jgi:type I restriction enzyme S subunit
LSNTHGPGYKLTSVGWIPREWDLKKLSSIVRRSICYGVVQPGEDDASGVRFIRGGDIVEGKISTNLRVISKAVAEQYKRTYLRGGELLVSLVGSPGETAVVPEELAGANIARQVGLIDIEDETTAFWLHQYLSSPSGKRALLYELIGSAQQVINVGKLASLEVPIPPGPERQALLAVLNAWDTAIYKTQDVISLKKQRKKALMQRLLSGKKRLPGFNGEWVKYHFGQLLREVKRPIEWNDDQRYDLISVRRCSGGLFHRESLFGKQILTKDLRTAKAGDFLFSKMQVVHGASGLVTPAYAEMKISGSYIAVVAQSQQVLDMDFFDWYSRTPYFYHQTLISSYGVHIEKMTFDFDTFLSLSTKIPPLPEQIAIVRVLNSAAKELDMLQQRLEALREQKKGLMQKLVTGNKRIRVEW